MYYLFLLGKALSLTLPRRLLYALADVLGTLQSFFARRDVEIISSNLKPIIGDDKKKISRYVRIILINFAYYLADFFRFSRINRRFIERYVKIENREIIDQLLRKGEKIILYSAHLGNYELGAAVIGLLGYPVVALALPHKNAKVNDFFNRQRNCCNVQVVSTNNVKSCFRHMAKGDIIAIVGDRDFFGKGERIEIQRQNCLLPRGPVRFALKGRAHIVPVFMIRDKKYSYRLVFANEISPFKEGKLRTEEELLQECACVLGRYIWKYPEQWYMFGEFWID